jgi:hypothetical protein
MWLKIQNDGGLDTAALFLMGASTKNETQIGYFGTGIKYALCWFLRNNVDFKIFNGKTEIKVELKKYDLRGEVFDVVYIDGKQTSLTTRLGRDWTNWYAVREVYCNALDEPNADIKLVDDIDDVEDDKTTFFLHLTDELSDIVNNIDKYFSFQRTPIFECKTGRIYERAAKNTITYRKGVMCATHIDKEGVYDYDLFDIEINEQREAKYAWTVIQDVWRMIYQCDDVNVLRKLLMNVDGTYEGTIDSSMSSTYTSSFAKEAWQTVLDDITICHKGMIPLMTEQEVAQAVVLPMQVVRDLRASFNVTLPRSVAQVGDEAYLKVEADEIEQATLDEALAILKSNNFVIPYTINVVKFNNRSIAGMADVERRQIYISDVTLRKGVHWTVSTLIEEFVHIKHNVEDETRGMQDALIDELIVRLMLV